MQNTDIIKDKLNILDVVGSYVKLEKAGKTYKGKSPFTNEKTPSFFVSPEKGFFYCFSSGKGGDMFTFIQEIERIDFREALKILADKAGVQLQNTKISKEEITRTHLQYKILDDATRWYEVHLRKNKDVVEHLLSRGLTKETIVKFRLGFALDSWRDIYSHLKSRKYTDADIEAVGLIIKKDDGGYYDRFRSRIMFPLFDGRGRVVGFSGRIFGEETEKGGAKYVNSPEGPLFDKSKVLYGYHSAKSAMSKEDACILVEGQFDVLLAQQSGYVHTVAISGTGLTESHVTMIKRFTDTIILALDSDKAGIKATRRSVLLAYQHGLNVKIIVMPEGMDPADTIVKSKASWDTYVLDAKDYLEYRLELFNRNEHSFEEKKNLVDTDLFTFVALTKSAMLQDKMLQKIALFLGVSTEAVRDDFKNFVPNENIEPVLQEQTQQAVQVNQTSPQDQVLYLLHYIQDQEIELDTEIEKQQKDLYLELFDSDIDNDLQSKGEQELAMQQFILSERHADTPESTLKHSIYTLLIQEKIRIIDTELKTILEQLRQAELQKNNEEVTRLVQRQQELLQQKTELTNRV